ncbi:MAG: hypothetical protein ACI8ZN_000827 [Bacteroidia bacterium]|jgi:hypothetical protein
MNETKINFTSVSSAYNKGLRMSMIWPIALFVLSSTGLGYLSYLGYFPVDITIYLCLVCALIFYVLSVYQTRKWLTWMVVHAENPKPVLELARTSFLSKKWKEKLAMTGKAFKADFKNKFDARIEEVRKAYLADAEKRYKVNDEIHVHKRLGAVLWYISFIVLVGAGAVLLFFLQEDILLKTIAASVLVIGVIVLFYGLKRLWIRSKTVLTVSKNGIVLDGKLYGWLELEVVDVIKDSTLILKPFHKEQMEFDVLDLSLRPAYLDELVYFYHHQYKKANAPIEVDPPVDRGTENKEATDPDSE